MTDRINSLTVVLDKDYRDDDAERIVDAIGMIKCVLSVEANVSDLRDHVAQERAKSVLTDAMWDILHPKKS